MRHELSVTHHFQLWQKRLLVWQSCTWFPFAIRPCGQLPSGAFGVIVTHAYQLAVATVVATPTSTLRSIAALCSVGHRAHELAVGCSFCVDQQPLMLISSVLQTDQFP